MDGEGGSAKEEEEEEEEEEDCCLLLSLKDPEETLALGRNCEECCFDEREGAGGGPTSILEALADPVPRTIFDLRP